MLRKPVLILHFKERKIKSIDKNKHILLKKNPNFLHVFNFLSVLKIFNIEEKSMISNVYSMKHFETCTILKRQNFRVGPKTPNTQKQNRDEIYVRSSFIIKVLIILHPIYAIENNNRFTALLPTSSPQVVCKWQGQLQGVVTWPYNCMGHLFCLCLFLILLMTYFIKLTYSSTILLVLWYFHIFIFVCLSLSVSLSIFFYRFPPKYYHHKNQG